MEFLDQIDTIKSSANLNTSIRPRKRAKLTSDFAQEIFLSRTVPEDDEAVCALLPLPVEQSVFVSAIYAISPKAVRDIWNRFESYTLQNFHRKVNHKFLYSLRHLPQTNMEARYKSFLEHHILVIKHV
jgi:hypothetical protein